MHPCGARASRARPSGAGARRRPPRAFREHHQRPGPRRGCAGPAGMPRRRPPAVDGMMPPLRAIQPTIGQSNSSRLPSQWTRRPSLGRQPRADDHRVGVRDVVRGQDDRALARDRVDRALDPDAGQTRATNRAPNAAPLISGSGRPGAALLVDRRLLGRRSSFAASGHRLGCRPTALAAPRPPGSRRRRPRPSVERVAVGEDVDRVLGRPQRRDRPVRSRSSRRRSWARMTAPRRCRVEPALSVRRRARSSTEASRKIFRSASRRTTVPMSRPAMTIPPGWREARWRSRQRGRSSGTRDTADTASSTRGDGRRRSRRASTSRGPAGRWRPARARSPGQRDERGRIAGGGDAALEREPRRRPVEQPRVAEAVPSLSAAAAPTLDFPDEPGPSMATTRPGSGRSSRVEDTARSRRSGRAGADRSRGRPSRRPPPAPSPRTSGAFSGRTRPRAQAVDPDGPDPDPDEALDRRVDPAEHPPQLALPALAQPPGTR